MSSGTIQGIYCRRRLSVATATIRMGAWFGPWSHCGVVDGDQVIEALALKNRVVRTPLAEVQARSSEHEIVTFDVPDAAAGMAFARGTVGALYDWPGLLGIPLRESHWARGDRYYCSKHFEQTLLVAGLHRWRFGLHGISPCQSYFNAGR